MSQSWRLIPPIVAPGTQQMAIDTWLLDQLIAQQQPPTLRFYHWQPAAISLGYHQKQWPAHWRSLRWQNQPVEVIRRPSGGRAVLHQGDLTYAITLPLVGRRQDCYRLICDALIQAWQSFGVALRYGSASRGYHHQTNCFALATGADLVTDTDYKLVGSAQLRREHCLLQHGSMRLWPDLGLQAQVFGKPTAADTKKPPAIIPAAMDEPWQQRLMEQVTEALQRSLNVTFQVQPLSAAEYHQIAALRSQFAIPAAP